MTTSVNLVEPSEFGAALLTELQANGQNVTELINFLKGNGVCDFSEVPELLRTPALRTAAAALLEKATPSTLATRTAHTARFYINSDDLASGRTNFFMSGPNAIGNPNTDLNTYSRASAAIRFNHVTAGAEGVFVGPLLEATQNTGSAQGARAVSGSGKVSDITLPTGTYRLSFVGLLASFPFIPGLSATLPSPSLFTFAPIVTSNDLPTNQLAGFPVDIVAKIGDANKTIATIMHYPSDHKLARNRIISGSEIVTIPQPKVMSLNLQRRHVRGTYTNTADSSVKPESIGFNKSVITIPGTGFPNRDSYNYLEILRIA